MPIGPRSGALTCCGRFAATSSGNGASDSEAAGSLPPDGSARGLSGPEPGCRDLPGALAHGAGGRGRPPLRDLGIRGPLKLSPAPAPRTHYLILLLGVLAVQFLRFPG